MLFCGFELKKLWFIQTKNGFTPTNTPYRKFFCILALPLTLIEYYFTRERITEEAADRPAQNIPLRQQLKEVLTDKYSQDLSRKYPCTD